MPTSTYHCGTQTHQNILFFKSSFALEYIHVESREWILLQIIRAQGLRTREITARDLQEYTGKKSSFLAPSEFLSN